MPTACWLVLLIGAWMLVEYPWGFGLFDLALGMQALKRLAQPDDIGGVIAFLASEDARWITGDTIRVDGGSKL
jgi:NAD(P)-dependent dehydrogenase (short-subunit alcohol dehydrogenase family)